MSLVCAERKVLDFVNKVLTNTQASFLCHKTDQRCGSIFAQTIVNI